MAPYSIFSSLRSGDQRSEPFKLPRRGYHVELGAREKALLEEDLALKRFKSYKNTVKRVSKIGDALTIVVIAASSYQLFAVAMRRKQERENS